VCGIGGVWSRESIADPGRIAALFGDALAHRGPDGEGFLAIPADAAIAPHVCRRRSVSGQPVLRGLLVHRRLSIIDLISGDQPMALPEPKLWIVFNGEIYNYRELRRRLTDASGCVFRTNSDTEVILQTYRQWGVEGFRQLNGIFAFALYDVDRGWLVLARDPVGVKPLYWTGGPPHVAFASEIRPLRSSGCSGSTLALESLAQYLFYRFVPAPDTLWRDVHKVVPGHAIVFEQDGRIVADVDFAAPPPEPITRSRASLPDLLAPRLREAVRRQMVSDVPVGAFLSGGLDSSMVVAALGDQARELPTFAVGFPDEPGYPSELAIASRAAEQLGTRHVGFALEAEGYFSRLPWAIAQVEEPVAHPGMLMQADLSALAHRHVKVVLTGQGADEPLGGYPRHQAARLIPLFAGVLGGVARSGWAARGVAGREILARIQRVLAAPAGVERVAALFSPLAPDEASALVSGCPPEAAREAILGSVRRWWTRGEGLDDIARTLYVDVRTSLAEDLLLVADKMSMAHSLEARVPYLDLEYLAAIESIPGRARVSAWGRRKVLQHRIGRRLLPPELSRTLGDSSSMMRRKRGFDVPVAEWFRKSMGVRLVDLIAGPSSVAPHFLDGRELRTRVAAFLRGSGSAYRQVLSLFVLEVWLRQTMGDNAGLEAFRTRKTDGIPPSDAPHNRAAADL
jgi:asparagine synthase (glutamine-hydrolysing)